MHAIIMISTQSWSTSLPWMITLTEVSKGFTPFCDLNLKADLDGWAYLDNLPHLHYNMWKPQGLLYKDWWRYNSNLWNQFCVPMTNFSNPLIPNNFNASTISWQQYRMTMFSMKQWKKHDNTGRHLLQTSRAGMHSLHLPATFHIRLSSTTVSLSQC